MSLNHLQQCWCVTSKFSPEWREWENEVVVYDCYSGDTHAFDAITAFVLQTLSSQSQNMESLMKRVADQLDVPADAELFAYLEKVLNRLASLRLAARVQ